MPKKKINKFKFSENATRRKKLSVLKEKLQSKPKLGYKIFHHINFIKN